jgi:protein-S-isoprenylcysteine O-methyltransferase Ste14
MTTVVIAAIIIRIIWAMLETRVIWASFEGVRLRQQPQPQTNDYDKCSIRLWDLANILEPIGIVFWWFGIGRMPTTSALIGYLGLVLLISGIAIRQSARHTLGKFFTGRVSIQSDHQLIRTGLYKYVRHPSYSGALLAHLGLGLSFQNWFSLAFSVAPFAIAAWYRMRVEDEALQQAFGVAYRDYSKQAKRLIPKLY